ncbi:DUF3854 domain-containing protein [Dehalococcoidia bacterium]|nr:DUF3854 domain-containing protein [Dehalococcoidia bacterium]
MINSSDFFSTQIPELLISHFMQLREDSGISVEVMKQRGYRTIREPKELEGVDFSKAQSRLVPGILMPVWGADGEVKTYQYRPDKPRLDDKRKPRKYENPKGYGLHLDIPPACREMVKDPAIPLFITEGIKKVDALVSNDACAIGLMGVWGFRGRNVYGGITSLSEWQSIDIKSKRQIYIAFDSDIITKPQVQQAMNTLGRWLQDKRNDVSVIVLPSPSGEKVGIDSYLLTHSLDDVVKLAHPLERTLKEKWGQYAIHENRICAVTIKILPNGEEYPIFMPLCNFIARIKADRRKDDGVNISHYFTIDGKTPEGNSLPEVEVTARDFKSMDWVTESWGNKAVIGAGTKTKDMLREAIQLMSVNAQNDTIYTHTGWRQIKGQWVFLHAGREDPATELPPNLTNYRLPSNSTDPRAAFQASLDFLDVTDMSVTLPLWAIMYLAPLCEILRPAFSLWAVGPTGNLKSTLVALALCHYGRFSYTSLPANWIATENFLEKLTFLAKDLPLAIDDYVPQQSYRGQKEQENKVLRVLRSQGDLIGRGRMKADTSLRAPYTPRGVIISTGETLPGTGQSTLARMVAVEPVKENIDFQLLTRCQQESKFYSASMSSYINWLALRFDKLRNDLPSDFNGLQQRAMIEGQHLRIPEIVAWLAIAMEQALEFGVESEAITPNERDGRLTSAWKTLLDMGQAQAARVAAEDPIDKFLEALNTLFAQNRAHLNHKAGSNREPEEPENWGWFFVDKDGGYFRPGANSDLLGWVESQYVYLLVDAAHRAVAKLCQDQGSSFPLSRNEILFQMEKRKILIPGKEKRTTLVWCGGSMRRVAQIHRSSFEDGK